MARAHLDPLRPFSTIGTDEIAHVLGTLNGPPLSGYIGGSPKAGAYVERLSKEWKEAFGVKHAIPCNSATSGLLAACIAAGVGAMDEVWTTPYSMSATAACALLLGATVRFIDIEDQRFGLHPDELWKTGIAPAPKAVIVTNLFGHPAHLSMIRTWCDKRRVCLIEDNAQAPMAMEDGRFTGTVGHIGVFSLNVHKHIQCGEGGVIVTDDDELAYNLQGAINHGELAHPPRIGLNLRMNEPTAAIAYAQLSRAQEIVEGRREIGLELCDMVKDVPWLKAHADQPGCKHVYYLWTALADSANRAMVFSEMLKSHGVPIRWKYAPLLHKLFKSGDKCPVVEDVDSRIVVFEVCAYDLSRGQMDTMREIFKWVTGEVDEDRGTPNRRDEPALHHRGD